MKTIIIYNVYIKIYNCAIASGIFFFDPYSLLSIYIYLQRPTWTADSIIAIGQEESRVLLIAETAANSAST